MTTPDLAQNANHVNKKRFALSKNIGIMLFRPGWPIPSRPVGALTMAGLFKQDKGGVRPMKESSMPQSTAVGSGSRPTPSRVPIDTSAPVDPKTLARDVPRSLK